MSAPPALLGRRAGLARTCLLLAATTAILVHLYLFSLSLPELLAEQPTDSWNPMRRAFAYTTADPRLPLYSDILSDRQTKFQYPPSSLLIFSVLNLPPVQYLTSLTGTHPFSILNGFSYLLFLVTSVFVVKIFLSSIKGTRYDAYLTNSRPRLLLGVGVILFLTFTFYPLDRSVSLGQVQTWITCALTVMLWCWIRDKKFLGGLLAGGACLIKPQYAVLLLWAILRQEWGFVGGFAAVVLPGGLVSLWTFGVADHLDYVNVLSLISRHGEAYYPNQSINGLLNRAFFNGENLGFSRRSFPPFHLWVYLGTLISAALIIGPALIWPARTSGRGGVADLSIVVLSSTIASPVAWEHHYGVLLPIYAFLAPSLLANAVFGRWTAYYLGASYLLTGHFFPAINALASTPFNVLQSYLLFGALLALAGLYALLANRRERCIRSAPKELRLGCTEA
jgi:alpha-1,2-mannosyltransferase